jgi:hypothetical protein
VSLGQTFGPEPLSDRNPQGAGSHPAGGTSLHLPPGWVCISKAGLAQNDSDAGAGQAVCEGRPSLPAALQGGHHGQRVHVRTAEGCWADGRIDKSIYEQLMNRHAAAAADLLPNATKKDGRMGGQSTPTIRKGLFGLSCRFADIHVSLCQEETHCS